MVINKSVEDAIVVSLMLAVQKDHVPVGSSSLSKVMCVSDSYLKKTLRRLVVAGLVASTAGKDGGYSLSRDAQDITLGDVYRAMEGDAFTFKGCESAERAFIDCSNLPDAEKKTSRLIEEAGRAFLNELDKHKITELLKEGCWVQGTRDWNSLEL